VGRESTDINLVNNKIRAVQTQLDNLNSDNGNGLRQALAATNQRLLQVENTLANVLNRVDNLDRVNIIWRNNFQTVGNTLSQLTKNTKYNTPTLRLRL
jgi:chromosome segregation ATPase